PLLTEQNHRSRSSRACSAIWPRKGIHSEPPTDAAGDRCSIPEYAGPPGGTAGLETGSPLRLPPPRSDREIPVARDSSVARQLREESGFQSFRIPPLIPHH